MSFQALKEKSVIETHYKIIEQCEALLENNKEVYYVGVKNTNVIPYPFLEKIESKGFLIHTRDHCSDRGRAIDLELNNPITGRLMSGSSSGTAINVFKGINDIGIGTDGGGSVLAPALALNLFAFISPLICKQELSQYSKKSTDGILFQPSIGFMSKTLENLRKITEASLDLEAPEDLSILASEPVQEWHKALELKGYDTIRLRYDSSSRTSLMSDLHSVDFDKHLLVLFDGPVDLFEYGDSMMGHYTKETKQRQMQGHKYYLTVINMLGLSGLVVPSEQLSTGTLLVCKSEPSHIQAMFALAETIAFERSDLETRYFKIEDY